MKKTKILVAAISAGMFFASCDSKGHEEHYGHDDHSEMESHEGHDHKDESAELSLNDGKRWKVNPEMIMPVREMKTTINSFATKGSDNFQALAQELKVEIDQLTSSCTMTGESHDQLHLWLLPHIKLVDELSKAENDKKSKTIFAELQESMVKFNEYFE